MPPSDASFAVPEAPPGFQLARGLTAGRYPLLSVFPGLDRLATASRLQPEPRLRSELFQRTEIALIEEDVWMYVSPWEIPKTARGRWHPVLSPGKDCIVVGLGHLRESPDFTLYLDIFHELRHILQRQDGAQLFGSSASYVRRPTEVDAYRFVVNEAKALGVSDGFLRDYLRVEWIDDGEFLELLSAVGVEPP